uniref:Leucine-rich repeat-containing N-terminal plant-type domain-containing protein n=1 Tax=Leptocylindrus danicus TaxID=163516 RepID=A0A7S2JXP6_9STRA|mmetsp:Transcript_13891/g.20595  ORF Transcript_13891/g.20595 Transcript_13891/m.20595 type:complete len:497 (+) Transcript_13891:102-1592(+)
MVRSLPLCLLTDFVANNNSSTFPITPHPSNCSAVEYPSLYPSEWPSRRSDVPSIAPSVLSSSGPSLEPSPNPTISPSRTPSFTSSNVPSIQPSALETDKPSSKPSHDPTELKHFAPSEEPSNNSSALPSQETTSSPTTRPSAKDSSEPTMTPSGHQSAKPSSIPSKRASSMPSTLPSFAPQAFPSGIPTTGNLTNTPVNNLISFPSQLPSVVQGILLPPNSTRHDVILGILTPDVVSSTSLDDASSSASLAFEWIVNEDSSLEVDSDQTIQRFIMGKIFFQMNGDRWSTSTAGGHAGNNWMDASHECDWLNVLCDENNRITEILIEGSGVHGALVDEIDWLANLRHYKMNGNSITGTIPTQFGNLTRLEILRLEGNKLVGEIPMEIYNAVKLVEVNLGQNNLEGSISTLIGNLVNIETLDIATNEEMTGSLPSEMESLENIASLHIEATGLTGSVPSGVCDYLMSNDGKITSACGGAWVTFTCNCHVGTICCPLPV